MDIILRYFQELSNEQKFQFLQIDEIYNFWNGRINVISRKDIGQLYERHILHSLAIAKFFQFNPGTKILDVGTGGGFPGIPLAIIFPKVNFTLVDSVGKKITVVNEVIKTLNLHNVKARQIRAEEMDEKFDFIISRAVSEFSKLYKWVNNKILHHGLNNFENGIIYLKGGNFENEIFYFKSKIKIFNISEVFSEPYFETKKIIYLPIA